MRTFLRRALATEDQESSPNPSEQAAIVMKGPLADVYSQALDVAYAKEQPPEAPSEAVTAVAAALESQQMDAEILQEIKEMANSKHEPQAQPPVVVYGVGHDAVTDEVVVQVVQELAAATEDDSADHNFVFIVDSTVPTTHGTGSAAPVEVYADLPAALESIVTAAGGKVYHSFAEYIKAR